MTAEKKDDSLESLFRSKLEENEVAAGSDLTGRFMHRLERHEFLMFHPSRFNIWYLAAAVLTVTVAGVLLVSKPSATNKPAGENQEVVAPETKPAADTDDVSNTPAGDSLTAPVTPAHGSVHSTKAEPAAGDVTTPKETVIRTDRSDSVSPVISRIEKDDISLAVKVETALITSSATSGCIPLHIRFSCDAADNSTVVWNYGDGGSAEGNSTDYIYDLPGTYSVTLTITGNNGRSTTATAVIEAWERPMAAFDVRPGDLTENNDRLHFVNLSTGAVDYLWDFGDGTFSTLPDPSYRYEEQGTYNVVLYAYSANGCADSVTVNDVFTGKGMYLRFPNAFIPNREGPTGGYYNRRTDEENQVFHPVASGIATYDLKIYSKAGLLVFESDDIDIGWDGYYKGELCGPGVYIWKVRGAYRNGQTIIMAGDVTLINY
jgi:PKD repeat protein